MEARSSSHDSPERTERGSLHDVQALVTEPAPAADPDDSSLHTLPPPLPGSRGPKVKPKLELVADRGESGPDEARVVWPFEGEEAKSSDPSRSFGAAKPGTNFAVNIPGIALPPPTELGAPEVHVRREESVIADARMAQNDTVWRLSQAARRASTAVSDQGYVLATRLGESSLSVIRRFEALPRKKQLIWVAAPYLGALVLVFVLLQVRQGSSETQPPLAPLPADVTAQAAQPVVLPAAAIASDVEQELPLVEPKRRLAKTEPDVGAGIARTLPVGSALYIRPDAETWRAAKLRAGHRVTVYPDFPAPDGWVLGVSEKGTVGFISLLHLEGKEDPSIPEAKPKKRSRRGRRSRR